MFGTKRTFLCLASFLNCCREQIASPISIRVRSHWLGPRGLSVSASSTIVAPATVQRRPTIPSAKKARL